MAAMNAEDMDPQEKALLFWVMDCRHLETLLRQSNSEGIAEDDPVLRRAADIDLRKSLMLHTGPLAGSLAPLRQAGVSDAVIALIAKDMGLKAFGPATDPWDARTAFDEAREVCRRIEADPVLTSLMRKYASLLTPQPNG